MVLANGNEKKQSVYCWWWSFSCLLWMYVCVCVCLCINVRRRVCVRTLLDFNHANSADFVVHLHLLHRMFSMFSLTLFPPSVLTSGSAGYMKTPSAWAAACTSSSSYSNVVRIFFIRLQGKAFSASMHFATSSFFCMRWIHASLPLAFLWAPPMQINDYNNNEIHRLRSVMGSSSSFFCVSFSTILFCLHFNATK